MTTGQQPMPLWAKLLVGLGIIIAAGVVAIMGFILHGISGLDRPEPARVEARQPGESFAIGEVTRIDGTPFVRISIAASRGSGSSYSYDRADVRNVMLLDTRTGASRRLLPDNRRTIERVEFLPSRPATPAADEADRLEALASAPASRPTPPDRWYVLSLDRPDSDRIDVVVGAIDGGQGLALSGIDGVESTWTLDAGHLAMIVRDRRKLSYRVIDMATFKPSAAYPLAID